eukprot:CAMPEP_0174757462 /NCGR_PEP_ID=MMETSP1094-20130205/107272_2 /TAXON_ID=156173 /ORGANISM="Chrysochromulina brevifilum, Strain UTEX LB 985" /LENGTH=59 /DNA_ID=CAMNT_0015963377 /DNA_START=360 /DNA_END=539 /DNA_ORIENTATION=-
MKSGRGRSGEIAHDVIDFVSKAEVQIVLAIRKCVQHCTGNVVAEPLGMLREADRVLGAV